ncbi:DUF5990 family protein [Streptacidiphilus monticola]|uniref:DUF5990 family protein n=1 Tax=Streptacidiphilus monticola TaxID=2161674 RepID=A0ABW1G2N1_9ACTN
MEIRIEAHDLPGRSCIGYGGIEVGVQRRDRPEEWLDLQPGDGAGAVWTLPCTVRRDAAGTPRLTGPYLQNRQGVRFVYLSWLSEGRMFRRAKLMLDDVPPETLESALASGRLTARLGLTDAKGNPTCASVRPPAVTWSAEPAGGSR